MRSVRTGGLFVRGLLLAGLLLLSLGAAAAAPPANATLGVLGIEVLIGEDEEGPITVQAEVVWQDPAHESYYWKLPTLAKNKPTAVQGQFTCKTGAGWNWPGAVNWHPEGVSGWEAVSSVIQEDGEYAGDFRLSVDAGFSAHTWLYFELKQSHGAGQPEQVAYILRQLRYED